MKVHTLKNMKIGEISLVDRPASPGAHVILSKTRRRPVFKAGHDVSGEARDNRGRWAAAGGGALAAGLLAGAGYLNYKMPGAFSNAAMGVAGAAAPVIVTHALNTHVTGIHHRTGGFDIKLKTNRAGRPALNTSFKVRPAQALARLTGRADATAKTTEVYPEGSKDPRNGLPVKTSRERTTNGTPIPLNTPQVSWHNAGGWPYRTADGEYVPAGSGEQQKYIEGAQLAQAAGHMNLPSRTWRESGGHPYVTSFGEIIPGGHPDAQMRMEARYAMERDRQTFGKRRVTKRRPCALGLGHRYHALFQ